MIKELLIDHFNVQKGMYFSERIDGDGRTYFFSDIITDGYWNYVYIDDNAGMLDSRDAGIFSSYHRPLSVYVIENKSDLTTDGYELISEESFMTYKGGDVIPRNEITVKRVNDDKEVSDFIEVFTDAYGGEKSPEQPYGELDSTYMNALMRSVADKEQFHHYVCYAEGKPVSVATLCIRDKVAGIYNVGTSISDRGRGYGTDVTKACIKDWINSEGKKLFLQTETGSVVERWYKTLGFVTVFNGKIYSKE